jgi:hypothetical protein
MDRREWLLGAEDWAFEEMDWDDQAGRLERVAWRLRGHRVVLDYTPVGRTPGLRIYLGALPMKHGGINVERAAGAGSAVFYYQDAPELPHLWCNFNIAGGGAAVRDIAEHLLIDLIAQLRLRGLLRRS